MKSKQLFKLLENEIEKAEVVLAAKSFSDELQSMAEKIGKMQIDELMPLVERIREMHGSEASERFNQSVEAALSQVMQTIKSSKEQVDQQIGIVSGEAQPVETSDMENPEFNNNIDGSSGEDDMDFNIDELSLDDMDLDTEEATPPLGRMKK